MTVTIKQRKTDVDLEKQILIHAITSTKFLKETSQALQADHLQIPYAKRVYTWILDYFKQYGEAPKAYIQDIYNVEKEKLQEAEGELIADFLEGCSQVYAEGEEEHKSNVDVYCDRTIEYAIKYGLKQNAEKTLSLLELDRVKEAEDNHVKYRKIAKITSDWINPNDLDYAKTVFEKKVEGELLKFPGALGDLLGNHCRGHLISCLAPAKAGKSFFLHEIRTLALFAGLKVVEINLEMTSHQLSERYYQRISAYGREEGSYSYPVFDCVKNQCGTCKKKERKSDISINDDKYGMRLEYGHPDTKNYKPCSVCRGTDDFEQATWFDDVETPALEYNTIEKKLKAQTRQFGDNYRLKVYPRFRASVEDIERDLDILEYTEGFVPDVVVVDYADIVKFDGGREMSDIESVNRVWQALAGLATERHCLVATASHAALRRMEGKRSMSAGDIAKNTSKINHLDCLFSINQTPEEEKLKIVRIGCLAHRHKNFNELDEVVVLRDLDRGQPLLDSEFVKRSDM